MGTAPCSKQPQHRIHLGLCEGHTQNDDKKVLYCIEGGVHEECRNANGGNKRQIIYMMYNIHTGGHDMCSKEKHTF